MSKPLVIDICCGLGGWSAGFLAEGWDAIGFDIERHEYGDKRYPGELILKDITALCGYDLRAVSPALVVASPPCQEFSYMAMPWKRGKQIKAALCEECPFPEGYDGSRTVAELTALYRACFRIARELDVPIVLENVKGAQPWVGRAQAHFGSYFLWGSVESVGGAIVRSRGVPKFGEALRPHRGNKNDGGSWFAVAHNTESGHSQNPVTGEGLKTVGHANQRDGFDHTRHLTNQRESDAVKVPGLQFSGYGEPGYKAQGFNVTAVQRYREGVKQAGLSGEAWFNEGAASVSSRSNSRKAASAMIAEIPFELAAYVARVFKPA